MARWALPLLTGASACRVSRLMRQLLARQSIEPRNSLVVIGLENIG